MTITRSERNLLFVLGAVASVGVVLYLTVPRMRDYMELAAEQRRRAEAGAFERSTAVEKAKLQAEYRQEIGEHDRAISKHRPEISSKRKVYDTRWDRKAGYSKWLPVEPLVLRGDLEIQKIRAISNSEDGIYLGVLCKNYGRTDLHFESPFGKLWRFSASEPREHPNNISGFWDRVTITRDALVELRCYEPVPATEQPTHWYIVMPLKEEFRTDECECIVVYSSSSDYYAYMTVIRK